MKKLMILTVVFSASALIGCGRDKIHSPTDPSDQTVTVTVPTQQQQAAPQVVDLSNKFAWAVQRFTSGLISVVYGNLQLGMRMKQDPYGGQTRLRVYDNAMKRHTYLADYANSSPIGGTNSTYLRDINPDNMRGIKMSLIFSDRICLPKGVNTCWNPFTFPNRSSDVLFFKPDGLYRLEEENSSEAFWGGKEVFLVGNMPPLESLDPSTSLTTSTRSMQALGMTPLVSEWNLESVEELVGGVWTKLQ